MKNKIFTKLLSITLVCVMLIMSMGAYGGEVEQATNVNTFEILEQNLDQIPIYITAINESLQEEERNEKMQEANYEIKNSTAQIHKRVSTDYIVELVPNEKREKLYDDLMFENTLNKASELISSGVTVNLINFFVNKNPYGENFSSRSTSPGDLEYWEGYYPSLGEHNGYKFLYMESSIDIETEFVEPDNISSSWDWEELFSASVEFALDIFVEDAFLEAALGVTSGIAEALGSHTPPYKISYVSNSRTSYQNAVVGEWYIRDILIRDDLNRYYYEAYAEWGTTQRFVGNVLFKAKYPISKNPSGTYEYENVAGKSVSRAVFKTPGYEPNTQLFERVIDLYTNRMGFFKHYERIDIPKIIDTLLK